MEKHIFKNYQHWIWLFIGAVLLIFGNGPKNVPVAIWLSVVFIIRFLRTEKNVKAIISLSGNIAAYYTKYKLVKFVKMPHIKKGSGKIPIVKTPYGNISMTICNDMNFPSYIAEAGCTGNFCGKK